MAKVELSMTRGADVGGFSHSAFLAKGGFAMPHAPRSCRALVVGLALAFSCLPAWGEPAVLTVGTEKAPDAQYTSIQAAIDAAPDGATVRVGPGAFEGPVKITRPVTLEGAGWERTAVVGRMPQPAEMMRAMQEVQERARRLPTRAARDALALEYAGRFRNPAIEVSGGDARGGGVTIRGLKVTSDLPNPPARPEGLYGGQVLVLVTSGRVQIADCAVVGSPGMGVLVTGDADVRIEKCLVAAVWDRGIAVTPRREAPADAKPARLTVTDCDVRNCYYAGVTIGARQEATVERCRVSGAAWHGVRYDDASPTIRNNRIVANARCGIYASGKTAATVTGNLFAANEMGGMACFFENRDTVVGNTFVRNAREGLTAVGDARPAVERNAFAGNPTAILCSKTTGNSPAATNVGEPVLRHNLFWENPLALARYNESKPAEMPLADETASVRADPAFADPAAGDFSLKPDSPARKQNLGAADPLPAASPWPLTAEERAIIPDGTPRDFQQGKRAPDAPAVANDLPVNRVSYVDAFTDLYDVLGREYPCFELKRINWKKVGQELLPRAKDVKSDAEFGLLVMELVARLEDSHAVVAGGSAKLPTPPFAQWDPGFACLIDDRGRPVVYYADPDGPAAKAGVRPGLAVVSLNGKPADDAMNDRMKELSRYVGYSSDRYLRYHAAQFLPRQMERGAIVKLETEDAGGKRRTFELPAALGVRYLPRLPVPIPGVKDSGDVSWTKLDGGNVGYIYVRRIGDTLTEQLDRAVADLKDVKGVILDVRGNSGGGFDAERSFRNFSPDDPAEPNRPRYAGPIAVLIDARCISAGEGWASWFVAKKRAKLFGETTAGASSRKLTYHL
jgi:hypothetical protein